jgi:hydrogenase maturation protease
MTIVVGGVGQLFQGDLDVGRHIVERLTRADLGPDVVVEDFYYGAVAVMQRLEDLQPSGLVLVGAERSGSAPGSVRRQPIRTRPSAPWEIQDAVGAAATGHVAIQLIVEVAAGFGVLPRRTAAIEVEPAHVEPRDELSPPVARAVDAASALARREVLRIRVLEQADTLAHTLRQLRTEPSGATGLLRELLSELRGLDERGQWGAAPAIATRLRDARSGRQSLGGVSADETASMGAAASLLLDAMETAIIAEATPDAS